MPIDFSTFPIRFDDILEARKRIENRVFRTPLLEAPLLNEKLGHRVLFKAEALQRTGAFKLRGAFNALLQLSPAEREAGVVAFSSGNHAQGMAYAAKQLGIRATIVMPADAPELKRRNTEAYGAEVVLYDRYNENRETIASRLLEGSGRALIKPFDDPRIIAGQGTIALEIMEQARELGVEQIDRLFAPIGGGGLVAGLSLAIKHESPQTEVWAVEPEKHDDTWRSLKSGRREVNEKTESSVCDSILTEQPGEITFPINYKTLSGVSRVSDQEALCAVRDAALYLKTVVEPGGVVGLAALAKHDIQSSETVSVVVLSGGNIDQSVLKSAMDIA